MKPLFCVLILLLGFAFATPANADDLVISRAVLVDVPGTLSIAEVSGREFAPAGFVLPLGLSNSSVHWLRLRVRAPATGTKAVLFMRPSFLNEVQLYEADGADHQAWRMRVTGNHYPYAERDRARFSLGFVVNVSTPEETFYLRVKTRSPAQMSVEALTPDKADRRDNERDLVMVFFVTSMLALLLWALHGYLLDRQPIAAFFALHQAAYTLFGLSATGYFAPFPFGNLPLVADWTTAGLYCAINFTPLLFCRQLFKAYQPRPALMRGFTPLLAAFPLELGAIALGYSVFAVAVNAVLIRLTWAFFVVLALTLKQENSPRRWLLQLFFTTITVIHIIFWMSSSGVQKETTPSINAIQILVFDGLFIGALFALIIYARARQAKREAEQAAFNLLSLQKKLELEHKLKELAEVQARTDYLTGLFNRRHFVELAERELAGSIRYGRAFTLAMIDIDHFKGINDTWGHAVGDVVLQKISLVIGETLRQVDIFGRTGGEEFSAVLVETDGNDAIEVGLRLCNAVASASVSSQTGDPIQVTISIGLAPLKGRNISLDGLLKEADQAMYEAKKTGRNRVIVHA